MLNNVLFQGWLLRKLKGIKLSLLMLLTVGYTSVKVNISCIQHHYFPGLTGLSEFRSYQLDAVLIPNRQHRVNLIYLCDCTRIFPMPCKLLPYILGHNSFTQNFWCGSRCKKQYYS